MATNKQTLKIYLQESLRFKRFLLPAVILVPLSATTMGVVIPLLLSRIIELLSQGQGLASPEFLHQLYLAIGASLLAIVFNRFGYKFLLMLDYSVRARLQQRAFSSLLHKSYRFYANQKVGSLTSHFIGFVGAYGRVAQVIINDTLNISISLIVGITVVFTQSWVLGLTLLFITLLIFTQSYFGVRKRAPYRKERKRLISELHGTVADDITNNAVVKMFGKEREEEAEVSRKIADLRDVYRKDFMIFANESNLRHAVMLSFQLGAIVVAAWLLQQGAISLGVVVFALTYLTRLSLSLFAVGPIINGFEQAMVESAPMTDILIEANELQDKPGAKSLHVPHGAINFKNIDFKYEDGTEHIFKNFNLQIIAGEKVGLVGTSGGGKTTVTKLLLRFIDVQNGSITIDGQSIQEVTQQSLRSNIAYVPQEPLLFHRSLRENIAYARPTASNEEVEAAAKKAHAHEFIAKLADGYQTVVGERGIKLSGGQRQRVAIARAILADAPILVLDEATSALDSESERLIQDSLGQLMQGRTSLVIAHRLSTIQKMDRIIVLEDGRITEQGTHAKLLAMGGTYATLWSHQSGGFIEE